MEKIRIERVMQRVKNGYVTEPNQDYLNKPAQLVLVEDIDRLINEIRFLRAELDDYEYGFSGRTENKEN